MKNSKIAKLLITALSMLLILTAAFGISAFAAETEAPEIVSKNVWYGDYTYFMFAVPKSDTVTSENTIIKFYTENPEENPEAKATEYKPYGSQNISGYGDCITFVTGGVPAQYISTYVYAKPVSGGVDGEVIRYSILEYLYERLYTGVCDDLQTALYNATLNYGVAAQANLVNNGKKPGEEGYETPIGDLNYVYIDKTMGTLDGKNYSGLYVDGTKLTLALDESAKPKSGYGITNIVNGESTHKKFKETSLTVKNTAIIADFVFDGETFENINHPYASTTADKYGNLALNGQSQITAWSAYAEGITDHGFGIKADPENSDNKVLAFRRNSIDEAGTSKTAELYITPETVDADYNAIVFEADLKFDFINGKTGTVDMSFATGQQFLFGTNDTNMTIRHNNNSIAGIGDTYHDTGVAKGEWFNFRVEYYILDASKGITRTAIYINDNLFQLNNYTTTSPVPTDLTKFTVSAWSGVFFDMYMDNMAFRKVKRDFVQPALDFEDGNIPSEIRTSTWQGDTDNEIEKYVENGEFIVKTESANRTQILISPTEKYTSFGNETINTWVFEADITFSGNGVAIPLYFNDGTNKYGIMIGGIKSDSTTYMWFENADKSGTYSGSVSGSSSVQNGVTHHLRFEYYLTDNGMAIKLIADGVEKVTITKTTTTGIPSIETMFNCYFDTTDNHQVVDITFDNVQFFPAYIER